MSHPIIDRIERTHKSASAPSDEQIRMLAADYDAALGEVAALARREIPYGVRGHGAWHDAISSARKKAFGCRDVLHTAINRRQEAGDPVPQSLTLSRDGHDAPAAGGGTGSDSEQERLAEEGRAVGRAYAEEQIKLRGLDKPKPAAKH